MSGKFGKRASGAAAKGFGLYIVIGVMLLALAIGVGAKYITQKNETNVFAAKEFYFSSNLLMEGGKEYILNSGVTQVDFTVANNEDELHISPGNIGYTVTVTGGGTLTSNDKTLSSTDKIKLEGGSADTDTITLSGLTNGGTYTVTASADGDYSKTISATFKVNTAEAKVYKHLDTSNPTYVVLTVWTENVSGDAIIKWNVTGLIPDNTDNVMAEWSNYSNSTYGIPEEDDFIDNESFVNPYSSRSYRFFKDGSVSCTVDDFTVTVGGQSADKGML